MATKQPDICDDLGFCFVQGKYGWSDLLVVHEKGQVLACRVSEVFSDGLFELLKLCRAILDNQTAIATLHDEPGGTTLTVSPDPQQHHIMTLEISGIKTVSGHIIENSPVLSIRVKRKQLLGLIMPELWKLYCFQKEPSFQRDRSSFSIANLLVEVNAEWDAHPQLGPSFLK